jgi:hypothetical protein
MKVLDTVSSLAQLTGGGRRPSEADPEAADRTGERPSNPLATIEARLAGVVVAALHEAFDRDRVRMDLERAQVEEEQRRAAEMLAAELRRQAADRALGQLRLIVIAAVAIWMISAVLSAWMPGMRAGLPRLLMGGGWALAFGALGCAFAGWQRISDWTGMPGASVVSAPQGGAAAMAPWLLLASLTSIAASLLVAL